MKNDEETSIADKEDLTRKFKTVFKKMLNILMKIETKDKNISTIFRVTIIERGQNNGRNAKGRKSTRRRFNKI